MTQLMVGVDIDGVIRNIYKPLLAKLKELNKINKSLNIDDLRDYRIAKSLNIDDSELKEIWFVKEASDIYYQDAEPYVNSAYGLSTMKTAGFETIAVTAQPNAVTSSLTISWLNKTGLLQYFSGIMFTQKKWLAQCDYYIEDSPEQVQLILKNYNPRGIYMIRRPWNYKFIKEFDGTKDTFIKGRCTIQEVSDDLRKERDKLERRVLQKVEQRYSKEKGSNTCKEVP